MGISPRDPTFLDPAALEAEERRIFDICHGCRLCFNLCPSFPALFDKIDEHDADLAKVGRDTFERVADLCFECKLCFERCPYTPPHAYELDFPRLMLRAKAVAAKEKGVTRQDKFLGDPDRAGLLGSRLSGLANFANRNGFARWMMEKIYGVDRRRPLPLFTPRPFHERYAAEPPAEPQPMEREATLFSTCFVNWNAPEVGEAALQVLGKNGVGCNVPAQRCCGMPFLDGGDIDRATENAAFNVGVLAPLARAGKTIVVPNPTCSYVLKNDYTWLLGTDDAQAVASQTMDLCEYLMKLHDAGALNENFAPVNETLAYQIPCHLRVQNIGFRSRDLLKLIPGLKLTMVEHCSGMDGTWGMKRQYYEMSLKVARKLFREVGDLRPSGVVTDCPLSGMQIAHGTGKPTMHPIQVVARAYGLLP